MKKLDIVIIAAVAALSGLLFLFSAIWPNRGGAAVAVIYVNNAEYARVPLDEPQLVTVEQGDKVNVVEVFGGGVRMYSSTCKNQLCVQQGDLLGERRTDNGGSIICLPNGVTVTLEAK